LPQTWGDPALLRQVWVNMIANALKYSSAKPRSRVQVSGFDSGEESVFCVTDNGVGFDMRHVGRLFGVFERLHRADQFAGAGVGLAVVKRVVVKHLGRVWAEGAVGEGARFFFSLPRVNGLQSRDQPR
jgi:chemotaxis family two-component system sensor kinase Cph1